MRTSSERGPHDAGDSPCLELQAVLSVVAQQRRACGLMGVRLPHRIRELLPLPRDLRQGCGRWWFPAAWRRQGGFRILLSHALQASRPRCAPASATALLSPSPLLLPLPSPESSNRPRRRMRVGGCVAWRLEHRRWRQMALCSDPSLSSERLRTPATMGLRRKV